MRELHKIEVEGHVLEIEIFKPDQELDVWKYHVDYPKDFNRTYHKPFVTRAEVVNGIIDHMVDEMGESVRETLVQELKMNIPLSE